MASGARTRHPPSPCRACTPRAEIWQPCRAGISGPGRARISRPGRPGRPVYITDLREDSVATREGRAGRAPGTPRAALVSQGPVPVPGLVAETLGRESCQLVLKGGSGLFLTDFPAGNNAQCFPVRSKHTNANKNRSLVSSFMGHLPFITVPHRLAPPSPKPHYPACETQKNEHVSAANAQYVLRPCEHSQC